MADISRTTEDDPTEVAPTYPPPANTTEMPEPSSADLPPPYTVLDEHPRAFHIQGCFVCTPAGPCYQLSSGLDQRGFMLRLRKLSARESRQVTDPSAPPLSFDKKAVLYDITKLPLSTNTFEIHGRRGGTLPGSVTMKLGLLTWRVVHHVPGPKVVDKELLNMKPRRLHSSSSGLEWKDAASGAVIAIEGWEESGKAQSAPSLQLPKDLETGLRDLLVTCWITRLWLMNTQEKTKGEGLQARKKMSLAADTPSPSPAFR